MTINGKPYCYIGAGHAGPNTRRKGFATPDPPAIQPTLPRLYLPCRRVVSDDFKMCGKPVNVKRTHGSEYCDEHRKLLPYWPTGEEYL